MISVTLESGTNRGQIHTKRKGNILKRPIGLRSAFVTTLPPPPREPLSEDPGQMTCSWRAEPHYTDQQQASIISSPSFLLPSV
jgi:hypothetical protein